MTVSVRKEKGYLLRTFFGLNQHNVHLSKIETKISGTLEFSLFQVDARRNIGKNNYTAP